MRSTVLTPLCTASFMFIIWVLCPVATANAQFRAIVQGSVSDAHGAGVFDATITLINKETNRTQQSSSSDEGFYRFDRLPPGKYMLIVEHTGFKKNVLADVDVKAEETQGINIQLEAGDIVETITVSAELSERLKTENANIARAITRQEVLRLPQYGRDPYELVRLAPGIFGLGARDPCCRSVGFPNSVGPGSNNSIFQPENQVPVSANGQRVSANNYEVDGVSVNSQVWGGAAVLTPNQESVKEMHVASSSYSAENGRGAGALIQVVSRNGTNHFHGSAFLKYQDPSLNAFNKWGGPFSLSQPQRVERHFRQWGGSIGGPMYLPRFAEGGPAYWSGKNKLFFFFSYETLRNRANHIDNLWIETPEFRQLLLSQRAGSLAARIANTPGMEHRILGIESGDCASVGMMNPTTCRAVTGGLDIGAPTGSIGQRTTDSAGGGLDNIPDIRFAQILFPSSNKAQQFSTRIDYQMTDHDLVVFSMYNTPNDTRSSPNGRPIQEFLSARRNTTGALLWNHTLSPTTVNEARFNVTRWYLDEIKSNPNVPFGIPLVLASLPFGQSIGWGPGDVDVLYQTSYNFRDILSKVVGNHGLRLGGEYAHEQNNDVVAGGARPIYGFNSLWDFSNDAPAREFGNFDPRSGIPTDVRRYIRANTYSLFAQDDWKVRPNLTLNFGLRWEYFAPLREKHGNLSRLLFGSGENALIDARFELGESLFEPDRNNFAPQIGFAWSPKKVVGINTNNKAVLRGGFGIAYNRLPQSVTLNGRLNPPFTGSFNLSGNQVLYSLGSSLNAFYGWPSNPNTVLRFDPNTNMPLTGPRPEAFATMLNVPSPYVYRYSVDSQYELGYNWIASLGYQGSTGHKFPRVVDYNLFVPPNLNLGNVSLLLTDVNSNFNAMIAQLSHRFAKGFDVHAQYRWSKSIDTCSNDDGCPQSYPLDQSSERGPSDYDVTNVFTASGMWDLPIFKNRRDIVGNAFGGWQLNGIVTASSGFPWTPVYADGCVNLIRRDFMCRLRPAAYMGGLKQDTSNEAFQRLGGTFGITDASQFFVHPPSGNVVVPPQPGIGRNVFRGPSYFSVDVSLVKRIGMSKFTTFGETAALDLRANFFNVFNTLNLAPFRFGSLSTLIDAPYFGRSTDALAGRVIEFQARFSF